MFYIAQSVCSDYTLATILTIIKRTLTIIQVIVPIILIVSCTIQIIKLVINPEQKDGTKKIINSIMAAVIIFFLPFIVNLTMNIIYTSGSTGIKEDGKLTAFNITECWTAVDQKQNEMDSANESTSTTIKKEQSKKNTKLK